MFWGVLVRAARSWRGEVLQGRGFGLLDGSLGLVAGACARPGLDALAVGYRKRLGAGRCKGSGGGAGICDYPIDGCQPSGGHGRLAVCR